MQTTRRYFFFGSVLAGAVPLAGFGSEPSLKALGYKSPNEKLNIASIGAGGKASSDIHACSETENIVALCDVDDKRAAPTFGRFPQVPKYRDYRAMLDKEHANVDAVIVTIPDHMHAVRPLPRCSWVNMCMFKNRSPTLCGSAVNSKRWRTNIKSRHRWEIRATRTKAAANARK